MVDTEKITQVAKKAISGAVERNKSEALRLIYEEKRANAERKYPGSIVAGPARYPVESHEKAWRKVHEAYEAWQNQLNQEQRARQHHESMLGKRNMYDEVLKATDSELSGLKAGDRVRAFWRVGYSNYTAIAEVVRVNACSFRIKLVDEIPEGYSIGQSWSVNKLAEGVKRIELLERNQ